MLSEESTRVVVGVEELFDGVDGNGYASSRSVSVSVSSPGLREPFRLTATGRCDFSKTTTPSFSAKWTAFIEGVDGAERVYERAKAGEERDGIWPLDKDDYECRIEFVYVRNKSGGRSERDKFTLSDGLTS